MNTNSDPSNADDEVRQAQEAVGKLLRSTRESQGLDVADVARVLRISPKYLNALEDGQNQDLPGTAYAIGFVRSYAEYLNLDGEEIVRRYKDQDEGLADKTELVFPKPIPEGGVPGAAVLGLGVVIAVAAYGAWYWNSNKDDVTVAQVEPVPEYLASAKTPQPKTTASQTKAKASVTPVPVVAPVTPAVTSGDGKAVMTKPATKPVTQTIQNSIVTNVEPVTPKTTPKTTPKIVAPVVEKPALKKTKVKDVVKDVVVTKTPVVKDVVANHADAKVSTNVAVDEAKKHVKTVTTQKTETLKTTKVKRPINTGPSRITIRAKSNSWIQIRDQTADRLLFSRLLRTGDEYQVPNRNGLRLMTGNAGALEVLVDGTVTPAIGAVGEVRRDVDLDPEKLKSGAAVTD